MLLQHKTYAHTNANKTFNVVRGLVSVEVGLGAFIDRLIISWLLFSDSTSMLFVISFFMEIKSGASDGFYFLYQASVVL